MRAYNKRETEVNYMRNIKKRFSLVSNIALVVMLILIIVSVATNLTIATDTYLRSINYPGTFRALFDYSLYSSAHPARFAGQILSNLLAYIIMFVALLQFGFVLRFNIESKSIKAKCAFIALLVLVPATLGLTGGVINFFGEGFRVLLASGGGSAARIIGLILATFVLDIVYLVFAAITFLTGLRIHVKTNKGESIDEEDNPNKETPEQIAEREEKAANERQALLNDIRKIVKEELNKLDRIVIAKEANVIYTKPREVKVVETTVVKEVAPAKEAEPAIVSKEAVPAATEEPTAPVKTIEVPIKEMPVVEEATEEEKKSAERIPFAYKMVRADKEIQVKYNELKNELLAYDLKSRVSISGDAFRLHRVTYVKITLIGKTLKVYFALNPKDFEESTIPVMDASDKASYEDVPALLKVKSNLSMKRAKELIAMTMEKADIRKANEPVDHNWIIDLKQELKNNK